MNKQILQWSAGITFGLVLAIMLAAFVLSYANLMALAEINGFGGLSWLWPLILDAGMIVANISLLFFSVFGGRKEIGKPTHLTGWFDYWVRKIVGTENYYQWLLVGAFTALSVWLNVFHAPETLVGRVMYGWAPATVFVLMELLIRQLRFLADFYQITTSERAALKTFRNYQEFEREMIHGNGSRPTSPKELSERGVPLSTSYDWWKRLPEAHKPKEKA